MDTINKDRRSALMKRVRQKDTAPELLVRRELHRRGLRYKVADRALPGHPDLSFPRYKSVIFVHGCFWHGHSCPLGRAPSSNVEYWRQKIESNRRRDQRVEQSLRALGWSVIVVWQCQLGIDLNRCAFFDRLAASVRDVSTPDSAQ